MLPCGGASVFVGGGLLIWNLLAPGNASPVTQGIDALVQPAILRAARVAPDLTSPRRTSSGPGGAAGSPTSPICRMSRLPEALRGPGSMLGIDNVEELLDTAVSMGLMTQEQADAIRGAVGSGESLEGLLGDGGLGGQS